MRKFAVIACLSGAAAVAMGALGAHALKDRMDAVAMAQFKTAVEFQFYHTIVLLLTVLFSNIWPGKLWRSAGWLFTAGIVLFSGSIYLLATREVHGYYGITPVAGPVTPLGGICFIAGWVILLTALLKKTKP